MSKVLANPLKVMEGIFLTNNPHHVRKLIKKDHAVAIGGIEVSFLLSGVVVLYEQKDSSIDEAPEHTINFLRNIHSILTMFWLQSDNSVNCDFAFALSNENSFCHSNNLAMHYCTAEAGRVGKEFSPKELKELFTEYRDSFKGMPEQQLYKDTSIKKDLGRISVANYHVQGARSSGDLGIKISCYCSFFEALFSTSNSELSHQLSERLAFFLCSDPRDRISLYKTIKKAYGVRSKVVHGDFVSKSQIKDLVTISRVCDDSARKVLRRILNNEELSQMFDKGNNQELDTFMLENIFGISHPGK